ncbi:ABC transporter permease [Paenibacillus larvae]|nr:ABC transporter permease [Paenibacillus larvae]MDT2261118.1 ABC transporter permease [Paenibacillus larvae]
MRKRQIAKMLAYENLFMGLIALVVGIGIGALLSSGFTKLLLVLMDSEMGVHFEIPAAAVLNTALVFFVIILYTSFSRIQADLPFQTDWISLRRTVRERRFPKALGDCPIIRYNDWFRVLSGF